MPMATIATTAAAATRATGFSLFGFGSGPIGGGVAVWRPGGVEARHRTTCARSSVGRTVEDVPPVASLPEPSALDQGRDVLRAGGSRRATGRGAVGVAGAEGLAVFSDFVGRSGVVGGCGGLAVVRHGRGTRWRCRCSAVVPDAVSSGVRPVVTQSAGSWRLVRWFRCRRAWRPWCRGVEPRGRVVVRRRGYGRLLAAGLAAAAAACVRGRRQARWPWCRVAGSRGWRWRVAGGGVVAGVCGWLLAAGWRARRRQERWPWCRVAGWWPVFAVGFGGRGGGGGVARCGGSGVGWRGPRGCRRGVAWRGGGWRLWLGLGGWRGGGGGVGWRGGGWRLWLGLGGWRGGGGGVGWRATR